MNKNKKGFTLIELLAVIVILAIIALIAVPVIMNVITKARISAFEDSAYGIVKAGEMYYTNALLEAEGMTEDQEFTVDGNVFKNSEGKTLEISGSLPKSGKVKVTMEGKVALAISNGEYCIRKATTESEAEAEKLSDLGNICDYKRIANPIFTVADGETSIPACITDNTECSLGEKVGVQVNVSKKYDFYAIEDDAKENKITLLMSENLGETVAWITKKDYLENGGDEAEWGMENNGNVSLGPITALNYLDSQTAGWTNIPAKTYQIEDENSFYHITRTTRATILPRTYYLGAKLASAGVNVESSWLFDGDLYWNLFADPFGPEGSDGNYSRPEVADKYGVRPVITISKTIL